MHILRRQDRQYFTERLKMPNIASIGFRQQFNQMNMFKTIAILRGNFYDVRKQRNHRNAPRT